MTEDQRDKKLELIRNQVRVLMQSFDTVQIFCSKYETEHGNHTYEYQSGDGNFLARYGQVRGWVIHEDARNSGCHNDDKNTGER